MQTKETWDKSADDSIRQRVEDKEKTLTREFNFSLGTMETVIDRHIGTLLRYTEKFDDLDDGLVREAWAEMKEQGAPDTLKFRPELLAKMRHKNADAVAAVFKSPKLNDVVAPEKASFRKSR